MSLEGRDDVGAGSKSRKSKKLLCRDAGMGNFLLVLALAFQRPRSLSAGTWDSRGLPSPHSWSLVMLLQTGPVLPGLHTLP